MGPNKPILLPETVLSEAFKNPDGIMGAMSQFIFYRSYSRYWEKTKRREYWAETCIRSIEYNVNLAIQFLEEQGRDTEEVRKIHQEELEEFFDNQFNLRQFLSGRTLWVGGTEASYKYPMSNFNCSHIVLDEWKKLAELCYLGMIGVGIGFRILISDVKKLKPLIYRHVPIIHEVYRPVAKNERQERTSIEIDNGEFTIVVGDSKEGWMESVEFFFNAITGKYGEIESITFNYNNVRPEGERLKTFGGTAGGPKNLRDMFIKMDKIIKGTLTKNYPQLNQNHSVRPIHALDLGNCIAENIVAGGVRSIAEIALLDPNDKETIEAKRGIWTIQELKHRGTSNNSVFYEEKPSKEQLDWQFQVLEYDGEPCFVNAVVARRRRKDFEGVNPCVEILLSDRGMCNLTTINVTAFVKDGVLDEEALLRAQRLSARAGLRMTLPRMELPEWDEVQQRDRLLGVSLTGWQDAMSAIEYDRKQQAKLLRKLKQTAREAADEYADFLGVNRPKLTTCVKPEGTQSQLAGGVSSGLHFSPAQNYLRRVRMQSKDPIARTVFDLSWRMHSDNNDGSWTEEILAIATYIPSIDKPSIQVSQYTYHLGKLVVQFDCKAADRHTLDKDHIKTMFNAYYSDKLGEFSMTQKNDEEYTVQYEVYNPTYQEIFSNSKKVVVDFPVATTAKKTKFDVSAIEQLEIYKMFLEEYTEHNPSNTISVRPHEWKQVKNWVDENWDSMLAVSFLALFDAPYPLLPEQKTTAEEVEYLKSTMKPFDPKILMQYDNGEDFDIEAGCETGACPPR